MSARNGRSPGSTGYGVSVLDVFYYRRNTKVGTLVRIGSVTRSPWLFSSTRPPDSNP